jgi:hypothetical protein
MATKRPTFQGGIRTTTNYTLILYLRIGLLMTPPPLLDNFHKYSHETHDYTITLSIVQPSTNKASSDQSDH